jgi:hypothetical protein
MRCPRLFSLSLSGLFVLLASLLLAQSGRVLVGNPPDALAIAQEPRPGTHLTFHQRTQDPPFSRRTIRSPQRNLLPHATSEGAALSFASAVAYNSGGFAPESVAVADVNGDGEPDLIVANQCADNSCAADGSVGVLLGNGDGTFRTAVTYDSGSPYAYSVMIGDVNGDGKPDLVVANECNPFINCTNSGDGSVGVLLGNGDGTFQAAVTYDSGGLQPDSVAVADVNGDGKLDIVVINMAEDGGSASSGSVGVLLGNGDGTFRAAVTYTLTDRVAMAVTVADVNGDGKPDLVAANALASRLGVQSPVNVLLGNGDGTFKGPTSYKSGGFGSDAVAVADANGDGKPDVFVVNGCFFGNCTGSEGSLGVLLGNGDGTFKSAVSYDIGAYPVSSVYAADVNADGRLDLVTTNSSNGGGVGILLGNGDGTFQTVVIYPSGGTGPTSVVAADVNLDGKPDLVVANGSGTIGVLINTDTSVTATTTALGSSVNPSSFGQTVTFTATVKPQGTGVATGFVTFYDDTKSLGSPTLNSSGVATISTATLSIGTHSITASYSGDSNFSSSTSPVLNQVVQGSIAVLSTTSLNFGNQTVGFLSLPLTFTLTNGGNIALTITSIGISGTNGLDFAQTNTCGISLPVGGSCTISVTFTPIATGTRTAAVTLTDNASNSPQSVSLIGVAVDPTVTLSAGSLTFKTQVVFTTSKAQTVTLTNTGLGVLGITKISAAAPFAQTNNCGSIVNPGSDCTINVTFTPTTAGSITSSLFITDNAGSRTQKVTLTGTGTYVQLTPSSVNFGNQRVGTTSLPKKITLTNKSSSTVSITGISITGTSSSNFTQTNTCGTSVAGGANCTLTVTFTPSAKGARSATVSVSDNGGGMSQKVEVSGTGR